MTANFEGLPPVWKEQVTALHETMRKDLEETYGPQVFEQQHSREVTAAHEAGHVIVG